MFDKQKTLPPKQNSLHKGQLRPSRPKPKPKKNKTYINVIFELSRNRNNWSAICYCSLDKTTNLFVLLFGLSVLKALSWKYNLKQSDRELKKIKAAKYVTRSQQTLIKSILFCKINKWFSCMISTAARCSEVCGCGHDSLPAIRSNAASITAAPFNIVAIRIS